MNRIYASFFSKIDAESAKRMNFFLSGMSEPEKRVGEIHLLFNSTGGTVSEGIGMHGLFKSSPVPITIYSGGNVCSIAAVAFLGAKNRIAGPYSSFMIHGVKTGIEGLSGIEELRDFSSKAELADAQIETILRASGIKLADAEWDKRRSGELWFTAERAKECGFVSSIGEFTPPSGKHIQSIG